MGWVDELGQRNISAMRELAGELRDEGDEGVGRQAREKKRLRKKEERRKAGEKEREERKYLFNEKMRERHNKFFLLLSYGAHLKIMCTVTKELKHLPSLPHHDFLQLKAKKYPI